MARHWLLSTIVVVVGFVFAFLMAVYPEQLREIISSLTGQTDTTVVLYVIWVTVVSVILLGAAYMIWMAYTKFFKIDVLIEKDSLCFYKYPYRVVSQVRAVDNMTNTCYSEVIIHNCSQTKINDCSLQVVLRKDGAELKSKVLSTDSTKGPNPLNVPIDGDSKVGFHPVCLRLRSLEAFLPNHAVAAGNFTGTLIPHGEYELLTKVFYDGKLGKLTSLGQIKIPEDFLNKATIPNDIQVKIDQGGFAVYAELTQGKVRAKFFGKFTDGDVNRALSSLKAEHLQVDTIVEENGKQRKTDDGPHYLLI